VYFTNRRKSATWSHLNILNFFAELREIVYFVVYFTISVSQAIMPNGKMIGKDVEVNTAELALRD
jgi:hypothetical protein